MTNKKFKEVYSSYYRVGMKSTSGRIEETDFLRDGIQINKIKRFVPVDTPVFIKANSFDFSKVKKPGDKITLSLSFDGDLTDYKAHAKPLALRGVLTMEEIGETSYKTVSTSGNSMMLSFKIDAVAKKSDAIFGVEVAGITYLFRVPVEPAKTETVGEVTVETPDAGVGEAITIKVKTVAQDD